MKIRARAISGLFIAFLPPPFSQSNLPDGAELFLWTELDLPLLLLLLLTLLSNSAPTKDIKKKWVMKYTAWVRLLTDRFGETFESKIMNDDIHF